jgi:hypothetical protein
MCFAIGNGVFSQVNSDLRTTWEVIGTDELTADPPINPSADDEDLVDRLV